MTENRFEAKLRGAIAGGEWERAREVLREYSADLREAIEHGPDPAARLSAARDLLAWARPVALAFGARAQEELAGLQVRSRYTTGQPSGRGRILRVAG